MNAAKKWVPDRRKHPPKTSGWKNVSDLLSPLPEQTRAELACLPRALEQVWPLTPPQRHALPDAIADLSHTLTDRRCELYRPYWHMPPLASAYLYYFLPWNIIRFASLLQTLPLVAPEPKSGHQPLLLDAGSGPLAFPLALWLAKPQWRSLPMAVFATDAARKPLELGKKLLKIWAGMLGQPYWNVEIASAPLHNLASGRHRMAEESYPWLAVACNTLNEIKNSPKDFNGADSFLDRLINAWEPLWAQGTPLLFVEPGTRLGGGNIMNLRKVAMENGLLPLAPCTHNQACPLLRPGCNIFSKTWCHFTISAQDAPEWLKKISREAGLYKTALSLSPLFLQYQGHNEKIWQKGLPCRVISHAFTTPLGESRYACARVGLTLLPNSGKLRSGALCLAKEPVPRQDRDRKSGAIVLEPFTTSPR